MRRGPKSKYSDDKVEIEQQDENNRGLAEHQLRLLPARKYDPSAGGDDGEGGIYSHLAELCSGDWSWRPERDRALGEGFKALLSVPPEATLLPIRLARPPQGAPRSTTRFTPDGRIAQYMIPPEKQARQMKTGDQPGRIGPDGKVVTRGSMHRIWALINNAEAA